MNLNENLLELDELDKKCLKYFQILLRASLMQLIRPCLAYYLDIYVKIELVIKAQFSRVFQDQVDHGRHDVVWIFLERDFLRPWIHFHVEPRVMNRKQLDRKDVSAFNGSIGVRKIITFTIELHSS